MDVPCFLNAGTAFAVFVNTIPWETYSNKVTAATHIPNLQPVDSSTSFIIFGRDMPFRKV